MKQSRSAIRALQEAQLIRLLWVAYNRETGESQTKAAEKIGIKQGAFNQYINGNISLNPLFIMKFCQLVGVNPKQVRPSMEIIFGDLEGDELSTHIDEVIKIFAV